MKIVHISTWKQRCGIADFAENIVERLASLGVKNEVVPIDRARTQHMTSGEILAEIDRCVARAADCDLVHVQHEFSFFAGSGGLRESIANFAHLLSALRAIRRPVVATFHTEPTFSMLLAIPDPRIAGASSSAATVAWLIRKYRVGREAKRLEQLWRKSVAPYFSGKTGSFRALAPTPRTALGLVKSGCARKGVITMPHGIARRDASYQTTGCDEARRRLGLPADSVLLTIFGFVAAYKGHRLAVDAIRKLPANYHLAIVGGPSPVDAADLTLNSIFETWEQEDPRRLHVTGYATREMIDLYHAATDICLAPFRPEFYSGSASIGWALSSGKPIIATNIPAFAEIQREGDCLLMCTPNAPHELAWNIRRLAEDPQLQQRLAQNALAYAEKHSWPRVCQTLVGLYREMTGAMPTNPITMRRDPPYPPFLRGGIDTRLRLDQTAVASRLPPTVSPSGKLS
jgi:glycosyltransferase involved in cell wall biosynthesis